MQSAGFANGRTCTTVVGENYGDPLAGLTNTLQTQFGNLQSNWGSYVSQVVSGLPTGILNLKTEATQLIADGSEQFAVLSDASQKTTCSPPVFVKPSKVDA